MTAVEKRKAIAQARKIAHAVAENQAYVPSLWEIRALLVGLLLSKSTEPSRRKRLGGEYSYG